MSSTCSHNMATSAY